MTSAVETTQVLGTEHTDGLHLVYLPKYCDPEAPEQSEDDESVYRRFTDYLARLSPGFSRDEVVDWTVQRAKLVEPVHQVRAATSRGWRRSGPGSRACAGLQRPDLPVPAQRRLGGQARRGGGRRDVRAAGPARYAGSRAKAGRRLSHVPGRSSTSRPRAAKALRRAGRRGPACGCRATWSCWAWSACSPTSPRRWSRRSCRCTWSSRSAPARWASGRSTAPTAAPPRSCESLAGFASDRWRRHKAVAGPATALGDGQGGAGAAGTRSAAIGAIVAVDRVGKGIRTAPRDALISLVQPKDSSAPPSACTGRWTRAGAMLGPLIAFGTARAAPRASTPSSSSASASPSSASRSSLLIVRDERAAPVDPLSRRAAMRAARAALLRVPAFRRLRSRPAGSGLATLERRLALRRPADRIDFAPRSSRCSTWSPRSPSWSWRCRWAGSPTGSGAAGSSRRLRPAAVVYSSLLCPRSRRSRSSSTWPRSAPSMPRPKAS